MVLVSPAHAPPCTIRALRPDQLFGLWPEEGDVATQLSDGLAQPRMIRSATSLAFYLPHGEDTRMTESGGLRVTVLAPMSAARGDARRDWDGRDWDDGDLIA